MSYSIIVCIFLVDNADLAPNILENNVVLVVAETRLEMAEHGW